MKRLLVAFALLAAIPAGAADFTFQFLNETKDTIGLKLFSRGESKRQWPAKNRSYNVKPENAVQELKIDCDEGEQICWGAWTGALASGTVGGSHQRMGGATKSIAGAGDRGIEPCTTCCQVCKDGTKAPVAKITDSDFVSR
jgi:hypothetical protein